jgi:hypothetical protein
MRQYTVLLKAGESVDIAAMGDYVRVISAYADFSITPVGQSRLDGLKQGLGVTLERQFDKITLVSQSTQTIELMIGLGRVDDNRVTIAGATDTASKGQNVRSAAYVITSVSSEILPLNAERRSLILMNNDTSNSVWVGGAGVTSGTGLKVSGGQSLVLDNSAPAALHAIANTNVSVTIFEELD